MDSVPWTAGEVALIMAEYRTHTAQQLSDMLGGKRSRPAVRDKLKRIGLAPMLDPTVYYTADDETYILLHGPHQSAAATAKHFGTSVDAVLQKARKINVSLGIHCRRSRWTDEDDAYLQRYYLMKPCRVLAKDLHRTVAAVEQRLQGLGISFEMDDKEKWEPKVRELHALGYTDGEIGKVLCRSMTTIRDRRQGLGLPNVRTTEIGKQRYSERCRKRLKHTLARNGFQGLHEASNSQRVAKIVKTGWQYASTISEAMVLDLLEQDGWQTKHELHSKMPERTLDTIRQVLYNLRKRGLIVRCRRRQAVNYHLAEGTRRCYSLRAMHRGKEKKPRGPRKGKGVAVPEHGQGGQPQGPTHQGCGGAHNDQLRGSGEVCQGVLPGVQRSSAGEYAASTDDGVNAPVNGAPVCQGCGVDG